ncbi:oxygen-independent coproporphyrinogen-III oxidase 1 [Peptoclostridium acidaminophilum DSM 3953]|uniref:Heme chaperone HemW n=1 Tax=Peptoclostridium acidaminophilum DSM 3953 TaxID=1286171 RepID=W8T795_PEPAC|nr:radical SAM family heme chaperone HemW [Peptoclostridium acidaminophilum]AHM56740.1 oxygen-independent coproporphyrinogen-III oxidase 1 [Peptoclostridium acidaminophilum DSM 3953]
MGIGLYVHIPFCIKKCSYCDFNSFCVENVIDERKVYTKYLLKELSMHACRLKDKSLSSIFIGGGTPSLLHSSEMSELMDEIHSSFDVEPGAEITMEANPKTLSEAKLKDMRSIGINRLSMGLQAAQNRLLELLGRIHTYEDFVENYNQARKAGFENISIDVMFSIPTQTLGEWMDTLGNVTRLEPEHISAYSLIVEEGTKVQSLIEQGILSELDEKTDRRMYHACRSMLFKKGYAQYEISNFSKSGYESRHNIMYWKCGDYLGVGPGAHSYIDGKRFSDFEGLGKYFESIDKGFLPVEGEKTLSLAEKIEEAMFMGLRMNEGIDMRELSKKLGADLNGIYAEKVEMLISRKLLKRIYKDEREMIALTNRGIDLSNSVFVEFLLEDEAQ